MLRRLGTLPRATVPVSLAVSLAASLVLGLAACSSDATGRDGTSRGAPDGTPSSVPSPRLHDLEGTAPQTIEGRDGYLFIGTDFDLSCGSGEHFDDYLTALGDLATVVADSGREVVWTVAPDKSTTLVDRLPETVPQDACFRENQRWQEHLLGAVDEPHYVDTLALLRAADADGEQVYWRGDSHWTSYGASLWLLAALDRLDPEVADGVEVTEGTVERTGDLYVMAGRDDVESAPSTTFSTGNTMETIPSRPPFDPATESFGPLEWRTVPGEGTLPGRTLVIGDSFSYAGLDLTLPLVERGAFAWFQYLDTEVLAQQVEAADTVVIEVAQRTLTHSSVATQEFVDQVEAALAD